MKTIQVIIKEAGKRAHVININNNLKTLQMLVGGYIETAVDSEYPDLLMIFNDMGKNCKGLQPNFLYNGHMIYGTVIFCHQEGDKFTSIPFNQTFALIDYIDSL